MGNNNTHNKGSNPNPTPFDVTVANGTVNKSDVLETNRKDASMEKMRKENGSGTHSGSSSGSSSSSSGVTTMVKTSRPKDGFWEGLLSLFLPNNENDAQSTDATMMSRPKASLPVPKHMLWGCQTPEEHYATIQKVCHDAESSTSIPWGEEGLRQLGFEFRMWHHPTHCTCTCTTSVEDLTDSDDENDEEDEPTMSTTEPNNIHETDTSQTNSFNPLKSSDEDTGTFGESFMVPIGTSLKDLDHHYAPRQKKPVLLERSMTSLVESTIDKLSQQQMEEEEDDDINNTDAPGSEESSSSTTTNTNTKTNTAAPFARSMSAVSLFSLATHHTTASSKTNDNDNQGEKEDEGCTLRLFHIRSNTLVTEKNHETFIAYGKMYNKVAESCMECAQSIMMDQGDLHWVTVCHARGIRALVSRNRPPNHRTHLLGAGDGAGAIRKPKRKVLLVVTGKGVVRAGIFSRRHLMTTGAEAATAIPLIQEAVQRGMEIVLLDPNANGDRMAMDVVEASLEQLFFQENHEDEEIYILAHSMAGAQLVRFLLDKSSSNVSSSQTSNPKARAEPSDNANEEEVTNKKKEDAKSLFLKQIKAVAFTDSNHNINWTKNNPDLTNLLVGPSCLYVKSHKPHDDTKIVGDAHDECSFWRHRFGNIRTLWAGTHEHALTNYTARFHIWDHFDSFLQDESSSPHNDDTHDNQDEQQTTIPTF
mmetsp:Transcript_7512/g.13535  ORF Transcript_7512/g.13535 Transcript_7512/m.13535 type:complete len:702 (-) Transcript_7512:1655-3760(-)|eukprot:CAMPEP_0198283964 /NCGR_PEP_ID=MMETSP1449-20131203/3540_1 /TAXON_ID=420275 /ORGANISM="Attheya septentrionalis, Strain CCMP2084" /LENGTH=701 /DNA_ID=CAMNT_0043980869 /DNA_START=201 /DNA_END=2306 /DNA_ORIENTATION=-